MIKAIITDVDGVIVGKQKGINFPLPSTPVIQKLIKLQTKGIPVVLNTAKFNRAVLDIIKNANLRNPHITDGGALIIDPLDNKVIRKHVFGKLLAKEIVKASIENGFYTEFYGVDDWFVQHDQVSSFTQKRIAILQQEHTAVNSLIDHVDAIDVIKIFSFIHKPEDKKKVDKILEPFKNQIHVVWSHHPTTYPAQNAIITLKGVSKKDATLEVLEYLKISPNEALGIGDTLGDWNFMDVCGYVGVVGSHSEELIKHAKSKGENKYFLGSDVDTEGFIEIIDYFIE
jgi:HAD superfamily hydrolase (TIGR01484 family)